MSEETTSPIPFSLETTLEALLFVAPGPVSPVQLAQALEVGQKEIENSLHQLEADYKSSRGLRLQWHAGKVQLTTAPDLSESIEKFLGLEATARLSRASLEALAIIAYRQPITRPAVDAIRGVNSDGVMRSLLTKGLVEEVGRAETPGRPILYGTTADFLQHFGLSSLGDLPEFEEEDQEQDKNGRLLKD